MQQGGGGAGTQSHYGERTPVATATTPTHTAQQQPVESASPISSRQPATSVTSNLDEFMRLSGGGDEDEGDRAGGVAIGNRWPRQETLALLKIRSDMDPAFRDATVKGPLWEDVSRKLSESGYKRSAKKCKEKFENVHKYYKRTKEGRAGRQDGKSYKFFSQLEALHSSTSNVSMPVTTFTLDAAPVSVGIPMPISSGKIPTSHSHSTLGMSASSMFPTDLSVTIPTASNIPGSTAATTTTTPPTATTTNNPIGINFSSDSDSSSHETADDDDEEEEMDFEGQPSNTVGSSRKRKRQSSSISRTTDRMMEFFESLMKQVIQKQETMQQRFLDVIEKREHDRMIREEAWKRQEMARLAREHEVMTQERAISASRDTAIISFLQKITGQTIKIPPDVTIPAAPLPTDPPQAAPVIVMPAVSLPTPTQQHLTPSSLAQERRDQQNQQLTQSHHLHQQQQLGKSSEMVTHQAASTSIPSQVVMAIPEQKIPPSREIGSSGIFESSSSRWPKVEVLALIKLRSGLEPRYQEAGPKGLLWEEISAGMQRIGYNRSAKRCKEKWENINKYFKKVKETNRKRPEDAKTCPYFHELDALYRKKILGVGSTSGGGGGGGCTSTSSFNISEEQQPQQHQQQSLKLDPSLAPTNPQESSNVSTITPAPKLTPASESDNKNTGSVDAHAGHVGLPGSLFGEGNGGASNKPEDIVKELMNQQGMQQQQQQPPPQQSVGNDFDKIEESNIGSDSDNMDHEEDYDEHQDELEEERKTAYKVEFQRQNTNGSNGGGNGAASFLAMVQ